MNTERQYTATMSMYVYCQSGNNFHSKSTKPKDILRCYTNDSQKVPATPVCPLFHSERRTVEPNVVAGLKVDYSENFGQIHHSMTGGESGELRHKIL